MSKGNSGGGGDSNSSQPEKGSWTLAGFKEKLWEEPVIWAPILYALAVIIGIYYETTLYSKFNIDITRFMGSQDFLVRVLHHKLVLNSLIGLMFGVIAYYFAMKMGFWIGREKVHSKWALVAFFLVSFFLMDLFSYVITLNDNSLISWNWLDWNILEKKSFMLHEAVGKNILEKLVIYFFTCVWMFCFGLAVTLIAEMCIAARSKLPPKEPDESMLPPKEPDESALSPKESDESALQKMNEPTRLLVFRWLIVLLLLFVAYALYFDMDYFAENRFKKIVNPKVDSSETGKEFEVFIKSDDGWVTVDSMRKQLGPKLRLIGNTSSFSFFFNSDSDKVVIVLSNQIAFMKADGIE